eukprot:1772067-Pyramimonas_sp.AAC.1
MASQSCWGMVPLSSGGQSSLSDATRSAVGLVTLRRSARASCAPSCPLNRILNSPGHSRCSSSLSQGGEGVAQPVFV